MELLNTEKIQNFVKWSIMELSTNIKIDHRNYCRNDKQEKSLLFEKIQKNDNNFDLGIKELSHEIIINEDIVSICIKLDNYTKMTDDAENTKDKYELIEEIRTELFNKIITSIGLFEISSLHSDYFDKFQKKFYEIVK